MTLYGIGLGPGDPRLITVRGEQVLSGADVVFTPGRLSRQLAERYTPDDYIEPLEFPMTRDEAVLREAWTEAAETVAPAARNGEAAFVTVGDPKVYSTFTHLERALDDYPDVTVRTVPGVSVVTAFAAALDVEIHGGPIDVREARAGVPDGGPDQCLLLKVVDVPEVHRELTDAGYDVTYGRRLFMDEATITTDPATLSDSDYFTIAYGVREGKST